MLHDDGPEVGGFGSADALQLVAPRNTSFRRIRMSETGMVVGYAVSSMRTKSLNRGPAPTDSAQCIKRTQCFRVLVKRRT